MCDYNCTKTCVNCFQKKCQDSIFHKIQNYEGEMTEENFDDLVYDITHSEVDEAIDEAIDDVEKMVGQYGFLKALQLYVSNGMYSSNLIIASYNGGEEIFYSSLLYEIAQENLEITWTYYQQYRREHPIC